MQDGGAEVRDWKYVGAEGDRVTMLFAPSIALVL